MTYLNTPATHASPRRFTVFQMLRQMHALARQRYALSQLEPHLLKDVGLSATDAEKEANRPFWDAPDHWR